MPRASADVANILVNWQSESRTVRYYSEDGGLDFTFTIEGDYPLSVFDPAFPDHLVEPLAAVLGKWLSTKRGLLFLFATLDSASRNSDDNGNYERPDEFSYLMLASAYYA